MSHGLKGARIRWGGRVVITERRCDPRDSVGGTPVAEQSWTMLSESPRIRASG